MTEARHGQAEPAAERPAQTEHRTEVGRDPAGRTGVHSARVRGHGRTLSGPSIGIGGPHRPSAGVSGYQEIDWDRSSVKDRDPMVHCSAGTRADGTTVMEPCAVGMWNRTTTVAVAPWWITMGAATSQVGPSAPRADRGPVVHRRPVPGDLLVAGGAGRGPARSPEPGGGSR